MCGAQIRLRGEYTSQAYRVTISAGTSLRTFVCRVCIWMAHAFHNNVIAT